MKFNIDNYKGAYVMHCKTEKEAIDFSCYLDSVGRRWCTGATYTQTDSWSYRYENFVYYFNNGTYGDLEYIPKNYTVLEWSDFMDNAFTKEDLRTGDVIKRRNGNIEIVIKTDKFSVFVTPDSWNSFEHIKDDLTSCYNGREHNDIVAVRRPKYDNCCNFNAFDFKLGVLVYERKEKEVEEMTLSEVCKLLGKEIKIVKEK